ncbi:MAG: hypothetical protein MJY78_11545, partial [Fibrobacter sp.]|nr:hypothetical protein [Fibrobacter sp.]
MEHRMELVTICPYCGKEVKDSISGKCSNCGEWLVKKVYCTNATIAEPEFGMICSICEKDYPIRSPQALPICPSCLKALRLLINSVKTQEVLNDK